MLDGWFGSLGWEQTYSFRILGCKTVPASRGCARRIRNRIYQSSTVCDVILHVARQTSRDCCITWLLSASALDRLFLAGKQLTEVWPFPNALKALFWHFYDITDTPLCFRHGLKVPGPLSYLISIDRLDKREHGTFRPWFQKDKFQHVTNSKHSFVTHANLQNVLTHSKQKVLGPPP